MSDSFRRNWLEKAHERFLVMQDVMQEEDTENQRVLDEEEVEYGHVDDMDDEMVDYARDQENDHECNFEIFYANVDFRIIDQQLEDDFNRENLDYYIQSEGMMTDNDLPEGSQRQESEQVRKVSNAPAIVQDAPCNIPGPIYFSPEDFESQYAATGMLQVTTGIQDEEFDFDFDGAYFYNDHNTTMQEVLDFLRNHPDVRGEALQRFHEELLDKSKLVVDLDDLKRLHQ